jgi:aspartate/methionine/tyrosine aminotransferase
MPGLAPSPAAQALVATRHDREAHSAGPGRPGEIDLNRGHTGFITADHIREAACQAIRDGHTHYEDVKALREAIADKLASDNGLKVDPMRELVIGGGSHLVLFDIMRTFVAPGDEVILARPGSPTYFYYNTILNQGVPVCLPLRPERNFKLDPDDVAAAISPRTKMITLTNPDTPAGAVHDRADLERIAQLAIKHNLLVVSDELYEKINFGPTPHCSIASLPGMWERTLTVNGVSKCYAMTGWRVGYAAGPAELIAPLYAIFLTNCIWLNVPAQYAALAALRGPQASLHEMVAEYERRMQILVEGLNAIDGIRCPRPEGGYYAWPDIGAFGLSSTAFARHALEQGNVRVGPGEMFGPLAGHDRLRTSFSATEADLREGLRRLAEACAQLTRLS